MDIVQDNIISIEFVGSCSEEGFTLLYVVPKTNQSRRMLKNLFLQCTLQCKNDVNWSVIIKKM